MNMEDVEIENKKIFSRRMRKYNEYTGIRIGEYIREKEGHSTRVLKINPDGKVEAGKGGGSLYLGENNVHYSSDVERTHKIEELKLTDEIITSGLCFRSSSNMGNANFRTKFRVWEVINRNNSEVYNNDTRQLRGKNNK